MKIHQDFRGQLVYLPFFKSTLRSPAEAHGPCPALVSVSWRMIPHPQQGGMQGLLPTSLRPASRSDMTWEQEKGLAWVVTTVRKWGWVRVSTWQRPCDWNLLLAPKERSPRIFTSPAGVKPKEQRESEASERSEVRLLTPHCSGHNAVGVVSSHLNRISQFRESTILWLLYRSRDLPSSLQILPDTASVGSQKAWV